MSELQVEGLYTYPIKSCAGTKMESADITERGLANDRFFMVTDSDGKFISQRTMPELALVKPDVHHSDPDFIDMNVQAPGMETLLVGHEWKLPVPPQDFVTAEVHGKPVGALRTNSEADEWFSDYLKASVSLLVIDLERRRRINERYQNDDTAGVMAFADGFPMLLASQASLNAFNQSMADELGTSPIPMDRFRPNIVVSGDELEPYDEDYWRRVQVGNMLAYVVRPCKRCAIPYVDQATAQNTGNKTVGRTLATTRRGRDTTSPNDDGKGVFFAQNLTHVYQEGLWINAGDEVTVLDRNDKSNVEVRLKT